MRRHRSVALGQGTGVTAAVFSGRGHRKTTPAARPIRVDPRAGNRPTAARRRGVRSTCAPCSARSAAWRHLRSGRALPGRSGPRSGGGISGSRGAPRAQRRIGGVASEGEDEGANAREGDGVRADPSRGTFGGSSFAEAGDDGGKSSQTSMSVFLTVSNYRNVASKHQAFLDIGRTYRAGRCSGRGVNALPSGTR